MTAAVAVPAEVCTRCHGSPPPPGKMCPQCNQFTGWSDDPSNPTRAILTVHAVRRAAERLGLNKGAAARLATRAFALGLRATDCVGQLRSYLDGLGMLHHTTPVIYGEFVYCFGGARLVTVLQLPLEHRKAARNAFAPARSR